MKKVVTMVVLALVLLSTIPAIAEEPASPGAGPIIADMILVRPASLIVSSATTAFAIGTMPLWFALGYSDQVTQVLVKAPWRFTAGRPLGDFENYKDGHPIATVER